VHVQGVMRLEDVLLLLQKVPLHLVLRLVACLVVHCKARPSRAASLALAVHDTHPYQSTPLLWWKCADGTASRHLTSVDNANTLLQWLQQLEL